MVANLVKIFLALKVLFFIIAGWVGFTLLSECGILPTATIEQMYFSNRHAPGILAPEIPRQVDLPAREQPVFNINGNKITGLASYHIRARVLSKHDYWFGTETAISPVDLALGWGIMSDQSVVDRMMITQGFRAYSWRTNASDLNMNAVSSSSANTHIIPVDDKVKAELFWLRRGDIIELDGYLVSVAGNGGWQWKSSLTRGDAGLLSCEVMLVEKVKKIK